MAKGRTKGRVKKRALAIKAGSRHDRPSVDELFRRAKEPPKKLTDAKLRRAEKALGVRLPHSYVELLKKRNGGKLRLNGLVPKEPHLHTLNGLYSLVSIAGIEPGAWDALPDRWKTSCGWDVPASLIPLDGDGHWWVCLDYRSCGPKGEPCVTHFEPADMVGEEPRESRVADSFSELITSLQYDSGGDDLFVVRNRALKPGHIYAILKSLSARQRPNVPDQWWWKKYKHDAAFDGKKRCMIWIRANGELGDPECPGTDAPLEGGERMLSVSVDAEDREACLNELAGAFGHSIELVHQPIDRPKIKVTYGETPKLARKQKRKASRPKLDATGINEAIWNGRLAEIRRKLEAGMDPNRRYMGETRTVLELAVAFGKTRIFNELLEHAKRPLKGDLLSMAASTGRIAIMKRLLEEGLTPKAKHMSEAVLWDKPAAVRLLIRHGVKPAKRHLEFAEEMRVFDEEGNEVEGANAALVRAIKSGLKEGRK